MGNLKFGLGLILIFILWLANVGLGLSKKFKGPRF